MNGGTRGTLLTCQRAAPNRTSSRQVAADCSIASRQTEISLDSLKDRWRAIHASSAGSDEPSTGSAQPSARSIRASLGAKSRQSPTRTLDRSSPFSRSASLRVNRTRKIRSLPASEAPVRVRKPTIVVALCSMADLPITISKLFFLAVRFEYSVSCRVLDASTNARVLLTPGRGSNASARTCAETSHVARPMRSTCFGFSKGGENALEGPRRLVASGAGDRRGRRSRPDSRELHLALRQIVEALSRRRNRDSTSKEQPPTEGK